MRERAKQDSTKTVSPKQAQQLEQLATLRLEADTLKKLSKAWKKHFVEKGIQLNEKEFVDFVQTIRDQFPELPVLSDEVFLVQIFDVLDADHSGSISYAELFGGLAVLTRGSISEKATMVFYAADANGDGKLDRDEVANALRNAIYKAQHITTMWLLRQDTTLQTLAQGKNVDLDAIIRKQAAEAAEQTKKASEDNIGIFVDKIFAADENNDGVLSMEEWQKHVEDIPELKAMFKAVTCAKLVSGPKAGMTVQDVGEMVCLDAGKV
eukprot:TRINITY_DN9062_c0_g2_i1.p1 TRINITY_DN9062_c0_g2~~TRINITY_DN9062_c0_g2_i1.p1  ORF type:complete len:292 (-),score=108.48 TRINITY_DN9062_c0_g2_i1:98-895(-)